MMGYLRTIDGHVARTFSRGRLAFLLARLRAALARASDPDYRRDLAADVAILERWVAEAHD